MMKRILLALLLLSLSNPAWATNWCEDANVVGCWDFSDGSGTTLTDQSSNNNDGSFKGSGEPAWASISGTGAPSYVDYMLTFDGSNDYVDLGTEDDFEGHTALTATVWINADDQNAMQRVLHKNGSWNIALGDQGSTFDITFGLYQSGFSYEISDLTITYSEWHHIAGSWDASGSWTIYIDGVVSGTPGTKSGTTPTSSDPFRMGLDEDNSSSPFSGDMTENAYFSDAKDSTDINDIMDNGLVQAGGVTMKAQIF